MVQNSSGNTSWGKGSLSHYLQGLKNVPQVSRISENQQFFVDSYVHLVIWWQIEILHSIDTQKRLDYIVYPTWSQVPGDLEIPEACEQQSQTSPLEGQWFLHYMDTMGINHRLLEFTIDDWNKFPYITYIHPQNHLRMGIQFGTSKNQGFSKASQSLGSPGIFFMGGEGKIPSPNHLLKER